MPTFSHNEPDVVRVPKLNGLDTRVTTIEAGGGGSGTVTSVSVTTANGISGTVATSTTTPAITLSLGAITPTSIAATGTVTGSNLSGTNTGDQNLSGYSLTSHDHSGAYQPADVQLDSLAGLSYSGNAAKVVAVNASENGFELVTQSGGGSDPWTVVKLAADFDNATTTFNDVTDGTTTLTFTPPADSDWEMEARILILTTNTSNLPRVGVNIAAGASAGYGSVNLLQTGNASTAPPVTANAGWDNPAAPVDAQMAAGTVPAAGVPYVCIVTASGRSGSSPTAITIRMAAETAAVATCYVKRGSFVRHRTV